jgi:DNA replication and repair protein RecF
VRLLSLELRDFRNHHAAWAPVEGASTLLLGENGSGKTNWIEGAVLLSIGRSFRGARDRDLARRDAFRFEVRGTVANRAGVRSEISARYQGAGPREVRVDGAALPRLGELLGRFPTVHFSVEDVSAWNGAPAGRRRFLDVALCQLEPAYVAHLRDYTGALRQRNRLLADRGPEDPDQLAAWEEILARSGAELDRRRDSLVADLDRTLRELADAVDPTLEPSLEYPAGATAAADTAGERAARLAAHRARDRRLGWTADGPHRAPVGCKLGGRELIDGASRGMTRLYSILLRLALARVIESRLEEPPVVFLDDPESELDARWIGPVLGLVPERSQVIVTACRALTSYPDRFRRLAIEDLARTRPEPDVAIGSAQAMEARS